MNRIRQILRQRVCECSTRQLAFVFEDLGTNPITWKHTQFQGYWGQSAKVTNKRLRFEWERVGAQKLKSFQFQNEKVSFAHEKGWSCSSVAKNPIFLMLLQGASFSWYLGWWGFISCSCKSKQRQRNVSTTIKGHRVTDENQIKIIEVKNKWYNRYDLFKFDGGWSRSDFTQANDLLSCLKMLCHMFIMRSHKSFNWLVS